MRVKVCARRVLVIVAAVGLATPAAGQLPSPEPTLPPVLSKVDPLLQTRLADLGGHSRVVVRASDAAAVDALRSLIQSTGGTPGRDLPIIEGVAAEVPNSALAALTNDPLVRRVALDRLLFGALNRAAVSVGAAAVRQELGLDGSSIGVAIIDSGVTAWHDDLTDPELPGSQRVDAFVDFVNGRTTAYDDYGHGTHVAGIIAGNGRDSNGARAGIAPGARLVVLKVLDGSGRGRISDVIAALGYVVEHKDEFNIRVVNLSIGAGVFESYESDLLTQAARRVVDSGIVVVAAAGNSGRDQQGRTQYGAITAPGNAPWVLTVGAASSMGTISRSDDVVAGFSSRGPTAVDRIAKPDLVAPGVGIVSLSDPSSFLSSARSGSLLAGTVVKSYLPYLSLSGTSQAAPVVAGTVALMLQANPTLTPNAVKAILQYTAEASDTYDPLTQGSGFLNARGAVGLALYFGAPESSPYLDYTASIWSGQLIWANRRILTGFLLPAATGWGSDVVWGSWSTPSGAGVSWGLTFTSATAQDDGAYQTESCDANTCVTAWTIETSWSAQNVVWGEQCSGADCTGGDPWTVDDHTVVWGTAGGETVVWGTTDGETVVWGTTDGETVVWGTTDEEDVVWETQCGEPDAGACEQSAPDPGN
jgi:serine protease AprX